MARIVKDWILTRAGVFKCAVVAVLCLFGACQTREQPPFDLLIRHGELVDGTGTQPHRADVGIRDGEIVAIGDLEERESVEIIDATGLVVSPGFIDVHTHSDNLAASPLAENFARMGVTTVVAGNCGSSTLEVADTLRHIGEVGISLNFATLVGHNSVRRSVMGTERRKPTPDELRQMKDLVSKAMREGALGLSTGLEYVPGTYSETEEIIELAKVSAEAGGLYASHLRNEGTELEKAVAEAIQVGETAGCAVQISHLKVDSPSRWGASETVLSLIDAARKRGVEVCADQYAYSAGSSGLGIRFPSWALEGGQERIEERLNDQTTWQRIRMEMKALLAARGFGDLSWAVVATHAANPALEGRSVKEIARQEQGSDSLDAQLETARSMMLAGGAGMVYHFMSDEDIARIMHHPQVAVASDSSILAAGSGVPHPRGYGNNPRVLGHYVREEHVIPLEEAVRKMTSLPAEHFGFRNRGLLKPGYAADLVLFDPDSVADRATYRDPHRYPAGIPHVIVNGVPVIRDGVHTGARPGRVLHGPQQ